MKKLVVVLCLLWSAWASASAVGAVSLNLRGVGVAELCEVVIKNILGRDYVLSPGAVSDQKLTLSIKEVQKEKTLDLLRGVLSGVGVVLVEKDGIIYVDKASASVAASGAVASGKSDTSIDPDRVSQEDKEPKETAIYWPRFRSVDFLAMVVRSAGGSVPDSKARADALIYSGSAQVLEKIKPLLAQVDRGVPSVTIRAAVIEFTESSDSARSFSAALSLMLGKVGIAYQAGQKMANALTYKNANLQAVLSAVNGDSRFSYLAEPSLRVLDGEQAKLVVGSDVPVRGALSVDKSGNPVQSIEYRTAGVVFTVEPRIFGDVVHLKIGQQVSSFAVTTTSNIDSPSIFKREASTVVDVQSGELVVMAGMDERREAQSSSGLSWVPSFLKSRSEASTRSQIMLLLEVNRVGGGTIPAGVARNDAAAGRDRAADTGL